MTGAELEIIIGADVSQAISALTKLGYTITKAEQQAAQFSKKSSTNFTGLSRVIQDLPFGFIAIQNNITQLLPAAGGLGLAVSVLTSAITFATVGFSNWTRGLGASKEQVDELSKSLSGAQTEIVKVSALVSVAKDLNESTATRTNAIKELQKEYPGYLGNLTLENVNSQETAHAVDLLSSALQRKAKVQAISNLLNKAEEALFQKQNTTISSNFLSMKAFLGLLKSGGGLAAGSGALSGAIDETASSIADAKKEVDSLSKSLTDLTREQAQNSDFSLLSPTAPKKIRETAKALKEFHTRTFDPNIIKQAFDASVFFGTANIDKLVGGDGLTISPTVKVKPNWDLNDLEQRASELSGILTQSISDAFVAIGDSIGAVLTGKGNFFEGIFKVMGEGLQQLGKYVIATSTLIATIRKALNAAFLGNPILGIVAGVALVALGSVLKNIPKFATGGVVTQPTLALVGEQGPERITPLGYEGRSNNNMSGEVVFQISGQTLRGILRRADQTAFNTF